MRIFVLTATYELRISRKSHLRDHPKKGAVEKKNKDEKEKNLKICTYCTHKELIYGGADERDKEYSAVPNRDNVFCLMSSLPLLTQLPRQCLGAACHLSTNTVSPGYGLAYPYGWERFRGTQITSVGLLAFNPIWLSNKLFPSLISCSAINKFMTVFLAVRLVKN
jgi:hypothetical protein